MQNEMRFSSLTGYTLFDVFGFFCHATRIKSLLPIAIVVVRFVTGTHRVKMNVKKDSSLKHNSILFGTLLLSKTEIFRRCMTLEVDI